MAKGAVASSTLLREVLLGKRITGFAKLAKDFVSTPLWAPSRSAPRVSITSQLGVVGDVDAARKAVISRMNSGGQAAAKARIAGELNRIKSDGHADARHGSSVTDAKLIHRSLTGYAPDGSVKINPSTGQPILPPMSSAFNSDEMLVYADNMVRENYLERAVTLAPGQNVIRINGVDVGLDVGRGYARIGSSAYNPNLKGPLQRIDGLHRVDAVYKWDAAQKRWVTDTIFPSR